MLLEIESLIIGAILWELIRSYFKNTVSPAIKRDKQESENKTKNDHKKTQSKNEDDV